MRFLIAFLLLFCTQIAYTQVLTVKDKITQKVLEWASISSEVSEDFVITDAQGKADISRFKGATQIQVRLLGYQIYRASYADLVEKGFVIYLSESQETLEQIVVSATRWRQSSKQVIARISKISLEEVRLQNPQTTADLLELSGEVFIQKSQMGGGSPMIRGKILTVLLGLHSI